MFILFIKFSGYPYKNAIYKTKLRKLTCITIIWTASRVFRGIQGLILDEKLQDLISGLEKERDQTATIIWIIILVFVDAVPYFIVLDWSFMGIFTLESRESETSSSCVSEHILPGLS